MYQGCNSDKIDTSKVPNLKSVSDISEIITPESHNYINFPSFLRTTSDYFLLYDSQSVHKFDYEGKKILTFGREGRGPGEFLSITNFWIRSNRFEFYDYNASKLIYFDFDGDLIKETLINKEYHSRSLDKIGDNLYVLASNGENNSLFKIVDAASNKTIEYVGYAEPSEGELPLNMIRQMVENERLPNSMYHKIFLGYNDTGIFSYQRATANLQKFNLAGDLLWDFTFKLPEQDMLFENFKRELFEQDRYLPELTYSRGVHVTDEGIAVLLNVPVNNSIKILWVDNDGNNKQIIEYPEIKRDDDFFLLRFRLEPENNLILFVHSLEGIVYKAHWPI